MRYRYGLSLRRNLWLTTKGMRGRGLGDCRESIWLNLRSVSRASGSLDVAMDHRRPYGVTEAQRSPTATR
jgi:hypothetical protein